MKERRTRLVSREPGCETRIAATVCSNPSHDPSGPPTKRSLCKPGSVQEAMQSISSWARWGFQVPSTSAPCGAHIFRGPCTTTNRQPGQSQATPNCSDIRRYSLALRLRACHYLSQSPAMIRICSAAHAPHCPSESVNCAHSQVRILVQRTPIGVSQHLSSVR